MNCVFDKIITGEIPSHHVYEDDHTLAFLDNFPHTKGHTLVIPKVHAETIFDLDDAIVPHLYLAVKKVMKILKEKLNPDGFNVGWNHNSAAGQAVPHIHVHVMPRWQNDGGGSMHSIVKNPPKINVEEVSKLLK